MKSGGDESQKGQNRLDVSTPPKAWTVQITEDDEIGNEANVIPTLSHPGIAEEIFFESYEHHRLERQRRRARNRYKTRWYRLGECHIVKSLSKIPHVIWSFFIETLYIPAYRIEWGKFRNWSYDKHGRKRHELDPKRLHELEQRRERRNFIRIRRREAELTGVTLYDRHLGCRRMRINCAGTIFETQARTLQQFPDTLLGDPARRQRHWNPKTGEYFFDRNPDAFESIIHFYQTGGSRLERPQLLHMEDFRDELKFFDIKGHRVDEFVEEIGDMADELDISTLPENLFKRKLWLLLEYPMSSQQAKLFSYLSIFSIVLSTITYCLVTTDMFRGSRSRHVEIVDLRDPLFFTEAVCVVFFTLELFGRLAVCPDKVAFIKNFTNVVDFLAILPFAIEVILFLNVPQAGKKFGLNYIRFDDKYLLEGFHRFAKTICVFRILKLSRYSLGLRILGQTLHASLHELALLAFFLVVGVILFSSALFYIENYYNPTTKFTSIPGTFFWAVSTMTTTGFDTNEELPKTAPGKLIGSLCAIAGVLTLSLPVPVVVANFTYFYHRGRQNEHSDKNKNAKQKKHIGTCPFLPTCDADHGHLEPSQVLSKASQLGMQRWVESAARKSAMKSAAKKS